MTRLAHRVLVPLVALSLSVGSSAAMADAGDPMQSSAPSATGADPVARALNLIMEHPELSGYGRGQQFRARDVIVDSNGTEHVRFDRHLGGLEVIGGDLISHVSPSGRLIGVDRASSTRLARPLDLRPSYPRSQARRVAEAASTVARARAVTARRAVDVRSSPRLVWKVTVSGVARGRSPSLLVVLIDAHSGRLRDSWDTIYTEGVGTGFHNGSVSLTTATGTNGYELRDPSRGNQHTVDKHNTGPFGGPGTLFTDADNVWGSGSLTDRQTVAVDAQYGSAKTWDYFLNIHGRRGIRNDGVGAQSRVHYGWNYNNAFWSDACFCITYGDGDGVNFHPFVSLDVAAHEMSHGVTSQTAGLIYKGESGGLNEATSDIFGSLVEFYANNANDRPDYYIGEKLYKSRRWALRAMHNPALDGKSPNCYSPSLGTLDVHYSSGVANHFFYLLAEGSAASPPSPTCDGSTVVGVGREAAGAVWYRALTVYMTSTTDYAGARIATLKAARDLYGNPSPQLSTVFNAWAAVGVR